MKLTIIERIFHKCFILEKSSKGINGMILWCPKCERRFVIQWDKYKAMNVGVNLEGASNVRYA